MPSACCCCVIGACIDLILKGPHFIFQVVWSEAPLPETAEEISNFKKEYGGFYVENSGNLCLVTIDSSCEVILKLRIACDIRKLAVSCRNLVGRG